MVQQEGFASLWYPFLGIFTYFIKFIRTTCLYNFDPLKPHFYIVNLGFAGVYIIFLILLIHADCGYSLEPPQRGGSNEYQQSFLSSNINHIRIFYPNIFLLLVVKVLIYLNRRVFVMEIYSDINEKE